MCSLTDRKAVFQSKADYELAQRHSKRLVLNSPEFQGIENMIRPLLDTLSFIEEDQRREDRKLNPEFYFNLKYLLDHIISGYPELYELILQNKKIKSSKGIHSACGSLSLIDPSQEKTLSDKERERLNEIEDLFTGKILRVVWQVKNGIPLNGVCEGCPITKLTVKD